MMLERRHDLFLSLVFHGVHENFAREIIDHDEYFSEALLSTCYIYGVTVPVLAWGSTTACCSQMSAIGIGQGVKISIWCLENTNKSGSVVLVVSIHVRLVSDGSAVSHLLYCCANA